MEASKIPWGNIRPDNGTTEVLSRDPKEQIATPEQEYPQAAQPLAPQPVPFKIVGDGSGRA